ncbi:MAG: hypothetical protein VXZ82_00690 [Planctomycetota bacterium]|nr:hypothetical protein [Planctomycetota bacterium]
MPHKSVGHTSDERNDQSEHNNDLYQCDGYPNRLCKKRESVDPHLLGILFTISRLTRTESEISPNSYYFLR